MSNDAKPVPSGLLQIPYPLLAGSSQQLRVHVHQLRLLFSGVTTLLEHECVRMEERERMLNLLEGQYSPARQGRLVDASGPTDAASPSGDAYDPSVSRTASAAADSEDTLSEVAIRSVTEIDNSMRCAHETFQRRMANLMRPSNRPQMQETSNSRLQQAVGGDPANAAMRPSNDATGFSGGAKDAVSGLNQSAGTPAARNEAPAAKDSAATNESRPLAPSLAAVDPPPITAANTNQDTQPRDPPAQPQLATTTVADCRQQLDALIATIMHPPPLNSSRQARAAAAPPPTAPNTSSTAPLAVVSHNREETVSANTRTGDVIINAAAVSAPPAVPPVSPAAATPSSTGDAEAELDVVKLEVERLLREGIWRPKLDAKGRTYYYNRILHRSTYDLYQEVSSHMNIIGGA